MSAETITKWANIYANGEVGVARDEKRPKFSSRGYVIAFLRVEITDGIATATIHPTDEEAS